MKLRTLSFLTALALLLLAGCRAGGPGNPARTVAEFFSKYENRPGFKATDWSAGLTTRLLLGRIGKLGGENDISQALSAVRSVKVLTFAPTTSSARELVAEGLTKEVDGLLANERYTPLTTSATDQTAVLRYSARQQGDRVTEFVATGNVQGAPDSFMLISVAGNFTREQVNQLTKFLPSVAGELAR
ncbi:MULTISPECIES: DUF4252 domain-containing protein [Hymenobacter]|uniref:DUF4252 domain-containing protein n=1 Tax=Hymenobacter mucosus TaxID=1411120 RepID=A0A238W704_9BACT|nr:MULTISPECIES: DUF4252 domain-containing protein [Hymenobacter]SNR42191.1 protein of unknown function [Hymenobacter mucosus]